MDDKKGFNKVESSGSRAKKFFSTLGLIVLSVSMALFTVIVMNLEV